jgi:hypothetical protein
MCDDVNCARHRVKIGADALIRTNLIKTAAGSRPHIITQGGQAIHQHNLLLVLPAELFCIYATLIGARALVNVYAEQES